MIWLAWPAVVTIVGIATHEPLKLGDADLTDATRVMETKRGIQKHLLRFATYVPMEDIIVSEPRDVAGGELSLLMQKACGRGKLYVWIPLRIRMPVIGERVHEWCWKPQIKSS